MSRQNKNLLGVVLIVPAIDIWTQHCPLKSSKSKEEFCNSCKILTFLLIVPSQIIYVYIVGCALSWTFQRAQTKLWQLYNFHNAVNNV
jgi:hypothetical protein